MFIIILNYLKPREEVESQLVAHRQFLQTYYDSQHFIASGRQNPPVGGVILCRATDRTEVEQIITHDPFYIEKIADYQIIEFGVMECADALKSFLS